MKITFRTCIVCGQTESFLNSRNRVSIICVNCSNKGRYERLKAQPNSNTYIKHHRKWAFIEKHGWIAWERQRYLNTHPIN